MLIKTQLQYNAECKRLAHQALIEALTEVYEARSGEYGPDPDDIIDDSCEAHDWTNNLHDATTLLNRWTRNADELWSAGGERSLYVETWFDMAQTAAREALKADVRVLLNKELDSTGHPMNELQCAALQARDAGELHLDPERARYRTLDQVLAIVVRHLQPA